MNDEEPCYISYLLRLRKVTGREGAIWRASLESPVSGERHSFDSLEDVLSFLKRQTGGQKSHQGIPGTR